MRDLSTCPALTFKLQSVHMCTYTRTVILNLCVCCLHGRQRVLVISQNAEGTLQIVCVCVFVCVVVCVC